MYLFTGKINRGHAAAQAAPPSSIIQTDDGPPEFADILEAYATIEGLFNKQFIKGDSAFPWISVQPLLEPLLNMHTTSYMSVIHETNALREVL